MLDRPRWKPPTLPRRVRRTLHISLIAASLVLVLTPSDLAAQFAEPCQLTCAAILGTTGFVAATGAAVAVGRTSGGMSTVDRGAWVWGSAFAVVAGGGILLSGDGERQERAIYAAGLGTLAGALTGLTIEALRTSGSPPSRLAGALMGATAGALVGGVFGALSYDADSSQDAVPLFALRLPL